MSGCPKIFFGCISHPLIPALTRDYLNLISVYLFPFPRILLISFERLSGTFPKTPFLSLALSFFSIKQLDFFCHKPIIGTH